MTTPKSTPPSTADTLDAAVASAIDSIAPSWPLDRMIAVNPHWGRIQQPFDIAAQDLARIAGSPMSLPTEWYREAWRADRITFAQLQQAARETRSTLNAQRLIEMLEVEGQAPKSAPLLADTLDGQRDLRHQPAWCDTITHQLSQFCAAYFDQEQADWRPQQDEDLYQSWRAGLLRDHSVALLMKASGLSQKAKFLHQDPLLQIEQGLLQLGLPTEQWPDYLQAVIMRVSGWASWCGYRRWQAQLEESDDSTLLNLLAIRLSWETLLDDGERGENSLWSRWQSEWRHHFQGGDDLSLQARAVWQRAEEISYQEALAGKLCNTPAAVPDPNLTLQAAFCIDVRSEVFRRHLEAQSSSIQTLGFAGFFGLPISYAPLGSQASRPQLPGLLAPAMAITDSAGSPTADQQIVRQRDTRLRGILGWRTFQSTPLSAFTLVEALGLGYLGKLLQRTFSSAAPSGTENGFGLSDSAARNLCPLVDEKTAGGIDGQVALASQVLSAMGLRRGLAKLVLLIGHGSQARNNAHKAGLDCGACCGQTGEVNARALAGLLNIPQVRAGLQQQGFEIPDDTRFVAGLHNTTTDEVQLYDLDDLAGSHHSELEQVKSQLAAAGHAARQERAPKLGQATLVDQPEALLRAMRERANDWAQTRPEWGLANNAAFIVAPRSRTRNINLEGRSFLHDYDHSQDSDGALLELIMTAPMVVTHWINMQYFASTVDNRRYGSGNKTLHNVVGGRLGVFEGNGGDLRIGLPMQSLHDGERWQHTPLRLTVAIEAPAAAIETVLASHSHVRQLVENRWLYLMRLEGNRVEIYADGSWQPWSAGSTNELSSAA